ncbi:MAG: helix-turn-helix transcriptional regulator [Candidatus Obscuribacterales bacterium]|nr:helix-turn-helix transcriptional regulator [Candidatus Obscuribacterales bacterium]
MRLTKSKDIGELVRKVRKVHKVTQKDLAAASGTGIRFIRELEKGKPTCELEKVLVVLSMLGIRLVADVATLIDAGQGGKK